MYHCLGECTTYEMFGIDFYDAILTTGKFQFKTIRKLESLRGIKEKELCLVGLPYIDAMVERKEKKVLESGVRTNENKNILLAPSWGESGLLKKYGVSLIDTLLDTGYNITIRPHPQSWKSENDMMDNLINHYLDNPKLIWNKDNDNFDVLSNTDLLISDFSAIMYEFAVIFDKPILYFKDVLILDTYDAAWLGKPEWSYDILHEIAMDISNVSLDKLGEIIKNTIESDPFEDGRKRAREEGWNCQMHSSEVIVDYLIRKHDELQSIENKIENK
jgi:CDP-glycerol glycerophosphotransferase (TagB/SpsB family)